MQDRGGSGDLFGRFGRLTLFNILSNLTVPLTGLIDTGMLGHLPDIRFLAGVALASIIFDYLFWGLNFLRMGTTGTVAQAAGRGDEIEAVFILYRSLLVALGLGLALIVSIVPIREVGFAMLSGEDGVKAAGRAYFNARIWGAPAVLCNFVVLGWLLGKGRSGLALAMTVVGNASNVGLDYLFIFRLSMDAAGAGFATAISQYLMLGTGLGLIVSLKMKARPSLAQILDRERILDLVRLNFDIMVRTVCLLTAFALFLNFSAAQGTQVLVANTLLHQLITFAAFMIDGPALAGEIMIGTFKGRGDSEGQRRTTRLAFGGGLSIALLCLAIFFSAHDVMIGWLTIHAGIVDTAARFRIWVAPYLLFATGAYVFDGLFLGLTRSRDLRNAMLASVLIGFLPAALLAWRLGDNHLLWGAMTLFALGRFVTLWYRFGRRESHDPRALAP